MTRRKWTIALVTGAAAMLGCLVSSPGRADDDVARLVAAQNAMGLGLYREAARQPGNVVISPLSIAMAMTMALSAARGETEREMAAVLAGGLSRESTEAGTQRRLDEIDALAKGGKVELAIANALFLTRQGSIVSPGYRDLVARRFRSQVFEGADIDSVNGWVKQKTRGKIEKLVEGFDPATVAALVNAVYFKGAWAEKFDPELTRKEPFHLAGGETVDVETMHLVSDFALLAGEDSPVKYQTLELPYGGSSISMVVVLPDSNRGLNDLETALDQRFLGKLTYLLAGPAVSLVALSLPRFNGSYKGDLVEPLQRLGIKRAFSAGADFGGLVDSQSAVGLLKIGEVVHQAVVEVNEEGTEAAAGTAVIAPPGAAPREAAPFKVDRPFLYLIVDRASGAILFLGRVMDPQQGG